MLTLCKKLKLEQERRGLCSCEGDLKETKPVLDSSGSHDKSDEGEFEVSAGAVDVVSSGG